MPFNPFWGEGYPTKIDYREKGTLILTSLLEDLASVRVSARFFWDKMGDLGQRMVSEQLWPKLSPTCSRCKNGCSALCFQVASCHLSQIE